MKPIVTATLVLANVAVFAVELANGVEGTYEAWGLTPAHATAVSLLTSMFLHAGWVHLVGNMVCLAFAGFVVEWSIGHLAFLALYLVAGVAGGLLHVLVDPTALEPMVGASGAICGVLAVMGALRPRLLGFVVGFVLVNVWFALVGGGAGVSFGTHLGGFAVGVLVVAVAKATGREELVQS